MKNIFLFTFTILLVMLFYAIPAYCGSGPVGCCQNGGPGGGCEDVDEGDCDDVFYEGSTCIGNDQSGTCDALLGSCCLPTNQCSDGLYESQCTDQGGTYQGNESICSRVHCPANPDHLMCYQVKDPLRLPKERNPKTIFISVPQFRSEARCVLKGNTRLFCAPACKAKRGDPPVGGGLCQPDAEYPLGFDRVCYNVENCTNISGQIDGLKVGVSDQFDDISITTEGPRLFENFNPHEICTPALKCAPQCPLDSFYIGKSCFQDGIPSGPPDGNCDMNCQCVPIVCGDGIIGPQEECDPPDLYSSDCGGNECEADCRCD